MERTGNFKTFTTGKYRSISNGICSTCGSSEFIYDYGDDTDIFLTTENLTDEIQVQPENEVKNCFKVSGGDDLITSTIQALQMSSSNRIVMFSDEQKEQMSEELRIAIEQYDTEYNDNQALFEDIVKTEYNVIDLIQYLQSGKMPLLAEDVKSIQEEVKYVLDSIISDYKCNFYVSSYSGKTETSYVNHAYTSASNAIKNLCTLYIDKGYSVKVSNGDNMATSKKDGETYINWNGVISIYETDDRENNYANIHVLKDGETYTDPDGVTYTGTYVEYGAISKPNSNTNLIEKYYNFIVKLGFGDTDSKAFMSYIEQFCNAKLASYKDVEYKNREEKDWKLYSYERLRSYYDAYEECLNALVQIRDTSTENEKTIVNEMYDSYASIQSNIEKQMLILRNQLNALYQFYGVYPNVDDSNAKDYIKKNYSYDLEALEITNVTDEAFIAILKDMADNGSQNYIGNKPFACQICGSSNVGVAERKDTNGNVIGTYNYCKSCKETDQSKITTYGDVARQIVEFISQHGSRKYVNNYYLDNLGENVYGSYLSPSIPSYQFSLKDLNNNSGYVLSSYNGQNVEPYVMLKTRRNTQSNKRYIVNHSSGTCYIIENNGDVLDVEVRYHSGGKLINSYTILEGGITRIQTSTDNEMNDEYEVTIDIKQRHGEYINCTIFKCFDPRGDLISYTSISDIVANNINYRGLYVWCSYETYNRIDVLFETNSIDSISAERNRLSEYFSLERYLGDDLYKELMLYIREDKYENSNYISDGCLTNAQLVDKAQELLTKAKQELAKACRQQYSISSPVYSIVATKYRNWSDNNIRMKIYDEFESFKLGNWIRARLDNVNYHGHGKDNSRYKMRLMSIQFDFENIDKTNVTYSNVEQNTNDLISKIQDTIASASSMATTYDYVATQAEQGEVAKQKIDNILQNGFDSALSAIKAGENQDITMDRHGLLFRQYLPEKDDYSQYQMKIINRNIVMTSNYWKTASLAIGLGLLPDGTMGYGIWADNIIGGKVNITRNFTIGNSSGSVEITKDGIILDGGAITWKKPLADGVVPQSAVSGLPDALDGVSKDIEQLDGRIQTYSQSDDPSTSWDDDEKSKHKGDIWFNPSDGLTKRWDGTKWDIVTDSNLVALAQSKGQIFTTQPTPPYNVGDLWIGNDESDLLRCQTSKKSDEEFEIEDWIVGVKYTDDTTAKKALSELADIGKDGVITPTEKQQIKMTINNIKSIKMSITKQCDAYDITKENVPLYKTYLDTYDNLISMVDSLLSDMTVTSNTPSNYSSLFSSYYTALSNMTTIIEEASKKYASDVASGIKTDLQGQIDGKIETFYQDTVPTWNASENSKHIGDLWYNTSSTNIVHSGKTYSAKTNYRFNGTSWEENSIIPKDFYDAVDGKSTVYSSIPQKPQDRDLLIPGADITVNSITYKKGKVYRYKSSDCTWNEINYTDDTALQEMLTSISADDKLSVTEKSYIKKQMDEIAKEYASIQARAERYSITLTSYQTAYTNLNNYISNLLSKMDEVSPITKSEFDNKFSNYYTELGVANGLIDTAIQSAAESTASKDLNAYKKEVDEFKELVDSNLSLVGVTKVASNYVYSPKIAGGYAYFTKDNYSVEIDPSHSAGDNTLNGYLFAIRDKSKSDNDQVIMGVDTNGNGYFSGEINATSGYIGNKTGWTIDGTTIINKSGDAVIQTGKSGSSHTQIRNGSIYTVGRMSSETAWLNLNIENGTLCCSRTLSNTYKYSVKINSDMMEMVDADGNLWLKANSEQNNITLGINTTSIDMNGNTIFHNSAIFNNTARYNNTLRLYASSTSNDYSELSCTSLSSSGSDAYFLVKSSMAIGYRLQVGNVDSFDNNHTFRVDGTSYVTGTSYTNSGTTVTSDKNKKNSISSPSDNYVALFDSLEFKKFKYNDGTSDRFHLGVIAQELEEAMNSVGLSSKDFGGLVIDDNGNYFVRYDEINTLTALKVKQLENRIKELEEELNNAKSNIE